jgi:hypothetical protein
MERRKWLIIQEVLTLEANLMETSEVLAGLVTRKVKGSGAVSLTQILSQAQPNTIRRSPPAPADPKPEW